MLKRLTFSLLLTGALALPAMAEPDADTIVAQVNGTDITVGHMIVAYAALPDRYRQLPPNVVYNAILDQLIRQTALMQSRTEPEPRHVRLQLENERRSLLAAEEIERVMSKSATPEELRAHYDEKYSDGFGGDEYNAAHILVESEEEAKAVKAELDAGADFAKTAMAKSTGPSGPNGGALGWFGTGRMVPEFETAVVAMEPGGVSDPVQTQFGWHIIKLNEKRKSEAPSFEETEAELAQELRQKTVENRIEDLLRGAKVERPNVAGLSPEILLNIDLVRP